MRAVAVARRVCMAAASASGIARAVATRAAVVVGGRDIMPAMPAHAPPRPPLPSQRLATWFTAVPSGVTALFAASSFEVLVDLAARRIDDQPWTLALILAALDRDALRDSGVVVLAVLASLASLRRLRSRLLADRSGAPPSVAPSRTVYDSASPTSLDVEGLALLYAESLLAARSDLPPALPPRLVEQLTNVSSLALEILTLLTGTAAASHLGSWRPQLVERVGAAWVLSGERKAPAFLLRLLQLPAGSGAPAEAHHHDDGTAAWDAPMLPSPPLSPRSAAVQQLALACQSALACWSAKDLRPRSHAEGGKGIALSGDGAAAWIDELRRVYDALQLVPRLETADVEAGEPMVPALVKVMRIAMKRYEELSQCESRRGLANGRSLQPSAQTHDRSRAAMNATDSADVLEEVQREKEAVAALWRPFLAFVDANIPALAATPHLHRTAALASFLLCTGVEGSAREQSRRLIIASLTESNLATVRGADALDHACSMLLMAYGVESADCPPLDDAWRHSMATATIAVCNHAARSLLGWRLADSAVQAVRARRLVFQVRDLFAVLGKAPRPSEAESAARRGWWDCVDKQFPALVTAVLDSPDQALREPSTCHRLPFPSAHMESLAAAAEAVIRWGSEPHASTDLPTLSPWLFTTIYGDRLLLKRFTRQPRSADLLLAMLDAATTSLHLQPFHTWRAAVPAHVAHDAGTNLLHVAEQELAAWHDAARQEEARAPLMVLLAMLTGALSHGGAAHFVRGLVNRWQGRIRHKGLTQHDLAYAEVLAEYHALVLAAATRDFVDAPIPQPHKCLKPLNDDTVAALLDKAPAAWQLLHLSAADVAVTTEPASLPKIFRAVDGSLNARGVLLRWLQGTRNVLS